MGISSKLQYAFPRIDVDQMIIENEALACVTDRIHIHHMVVEYSFVSVFAVPNNIFDCRAHNSTWGQ